VTVYTYFFNLFCCWRCTSSAQEEQGQAAGTCLKALGNGEDQPLDDWVGLDTGPVQDQSPWNFAPVPASRPTLLNLHQALTEKALHMALGF